MKQFLITLCMFIATISSQAACPEKGMWFPTENRSITNQQGSEFAVLSLAADYESCQLQLQAVENLVIVIRAESGGLVYMEKISTPSPLTHGISLTHLKPGIYTLELNLGSEKWENQFIIK